MFGYVPPDEDFNPEHPASRTTPSRSRVLLQLVAQHLGFIGTEAGCDWTVPYVDCVSSMGVPNKYIGVPLFNLVYHDAVMTPYSPTDLHGYLNGGLPQMGRMQQAWEKKINSASNA